MLRAAPAARPAEYPDMLVALRFIADPSRSGAVAGRLAGRVRHVESIGQSSGGVAFRSTDSLPALRFFGKAWLVREPVKALVNSQLGCRTI